MKKSNREFPLRFLIKGALWRVKFRKDLEEEGDPCSGLTDATERTITLDKSLEGERLLWVFYHEYAHAVLHESGVTGNTGGLEDLTEEIICDNFADAMTRDKKVKWTRIKKERL